jgi:D-3-phosphoglycerate dehydrogenase / 2-oxoglutarate reductase
MAKILIADQIAQEGIDRLSVQHDVVVKTGLSEDELVAEVADVAALIVRSQTQVTARIIEAAGSLEVIARAGVGVDNVDVDAATAAGIVVVNAPHANTISTAEHAFGLMLAVARNIPQGHQALRAGAWERSKWSGVELAGKTLGIIGLGRIGSEVAKRARAFEMRLLAFDPYVSSDRARTLGVEMVELAELMEQSDFVTLHTALHEGNRRMVNTDLLARAKPGLRLINAARGPLVDEEALYQAVESGQIAGAAIDVFSEEPAIGNILTTHDRIVVTPHLAASTEEAQDRAALDVAEQIIEILRGGAPRYPVNVPTVDPETMAIIAPYIDAAELAGRVAMQLATARLQRVRIEYLGEIGNQDTTPLKAAAIVGMLDEVTTEKISAVNALATAEARGLIIEEDRGRAPDPYSNVVAVTVLTNNGDEHVAATFRDDGVEIVGINDYRVDIRGNQPLVAIENIDKPGTIGRVGVLLGDIGVNISSMSVSRGRGELALMLLGVSRELTNEEIARVGALENIHTIRQILVRQ